MRESLRFLLVLLAAAAIPACGLNQGNGNSNPPQFGGLTNAMPGTAAGEVILSWTPAIDFSGGGITYNIYLSYGGPGTENLSSPYATTTAATGITLSALTSKDSASIIVQAQDASGNTDGNQVEFTVPVP